MITAVDTNILFDILVPNIQFFERSAQYLEEAGNVGAVVICDFAYSELCIHFSTQRQCDDFLDHNEISVESLRKEALFSRSCLEDISSTGWKTDPNFS